MHRPSTFRLAIAAPQFDWSIKMKAGTMYVPAAIVVCATALVCLPAPALSYSQPKPALALQAARMLNILSSWAPYICVETQ
jgi:hypothetical protein